MVEQAVGREVLVDDPKCSDSLSPRPAPETPDPTAAFVAAAAMLMAGALLLAGGLAWANGGGKVWAPWDPVPEVAAIPAVDVPTDLKSRDTRARGRAVCVRLCDGFFFPSATSSGGDEACAAQCPDAPTARYTEPGGSDNIEDAVSKLGALYTALPVASRYRTTLDSACTCHRSPAHGYSRFHAERSHAAKGRCGDDAKRIVVFQGAKTRSITSSDFVALSEARSLSKDLRTTLVDMERAGPSQRQVGVYTSPSASSASEPRVHSTGVSGASAIVSYFLVSVGCRPLVDRLADAEIGAMRTATWAEAGRVAIELEGARATRMTLTASPINSTRRDSLSGPRGVDILIGRNKGVNLGENVLMEPPLRLG